VFCYLIVQGLGKTIQTISLLGHLCLERFAGQDFGPSLVVCPLSVSKDYIFTRDDEARVLT